MKNEAMHRAATILLAWTVLARLEAAGAEVQLRARCQPRAAIVTLGDVADVLCTDAAEAKRLAATELFPAPAAGQTRILRVRELQDMLAERGVGLAGHRLSGSSQVTIAAPGDRDSGGDAPAVSASLVKRAERLVSEAITRFLREQSGDDSWQVEVRLSDAQAAAIPADGRKISIGGGRPPWTGTQQFTVLASDAAPPGGLVVSAEVAQRLPVVVINRALARGDAIRPGDVQLQRPSPETAGLETFHSLEDVAGMETTQAVPAGTVLQRSMVRSPLLVHRGEIVTVYARGAGIRVRATARAREDGALGDLVAVESLLDRKAYTARVCGIQEAEVYARAVQGGPSPAGDAARPSSGNTARARQGSVR